jgi:hypothetical protein
MQEDFCKLWCRQSPPPPLETIQLILILWAPAGGLKKCTAQNCYTSYRFLPFHLTFFLRRSIIHYSLLFFDSPPLHPPISSCSSFTFFLFLSPFIPIQPTLQFVRLKQLSSINVVSFLNVNSPSHPCIHMSSFLMDFHHSHPTREYELITEAHAQLSVVRNCSRFSLPVCSEEGNQLAGGGWLAVKRGGGADNTQGERIWSNLGRQKVNHGLLLIIHILCTLLFSHHCPNIFFFSPYLHLPLHYRQVFFSHPFLNYIPHSSPSINPIFS